MKATRRQPSWSGALKGFLLATHTYSDDDRGRPWLLYDDARDPLQTNNLISWSSRDNPEVVALQQAMHAKLVAWLKRVGDAGENGDVINDRYQPGHIGGSLRIQADPEFEQLRTKRAD